MASGGSRLRKLCRKASGVMLSPLREWRIAAEAEKAHSAVYRKLV
jgi:hypothetical protein